MAAPVDAGPAACVARYADGFDAAHLRDHGVASPLGLWLLLALVAPASPGRQRAALEEVLGAEAGRAAAWAGALLADPHPAVAVALAVWARPRFLDARAFDAWAATLPAAVDRGDVPAPPGADRWAAERTLGLIPRFPVEVGPETALVLASALATRVSWAVPFDEAPAAALGGPFGGPARTALRAPPAHARFLAETAAAGLVGVHAAESADGLCVVSVIAAPDVGPPAVHRAAAEAAALVIGLPAPARPARRVGLYDLPLGEGHAWSLAERPADGPAAPAEVVDAVLPAWGTSSDHDLMASPGVREALPALDALLAPAYRPGAFSARQAAVASFTREGFEAAAVTALAMRATGALLPGVQRHATIRFNRPFAVAAVARSTGVGGDRVAGPAWDGVGVFSAWVARPAG